MDCYRVSDDYFFNRNDFMNTLRKQNKLCDITIMVGARSIPAHKIVLVAACPYIENLLSGSWSVPDQNEIDMKNITDDYTHMEMIVEFMYTGSIDIQEDNVEHITRISSYLLIMPLFDLCVKFTSDTLCLQNCLKYYHIASDHHNQMKNIESKISSLVKARFHDVLIDRYETFEVSPRTLAELYLCDALDSCQPRALFKFIVLWVLNGMTPDHMHVGLDILNSRSMFSDQISKQLVPSEKSYVPTVCQVISHAFDHNLGRIDGMADFLSRAMYLSNQYEPAKERHRVTSEAAEGGLQNANELPACDDADLEDIIVTMSKELQYTDPDHVAAESENKSGRGKEWNVCAYVPRTKCWFLICKANGESKTDLTIVPDQESRINWAVSTDGKNLVLTSESLDITDNITAVKTQQDNVIFTNWFHKEKIGTNITTNRSLAPHRPDTSLAPHRPETDSNDKVVHFEKQVYVTGMNDIRYKIIVHQVTRTCCTTVSFKCHENGVPEKIIFETDEYEWSDCRGRLISSVSTVSNELMVGYIHELRNSIYFVVDLNKEPCLPVRLSMPKQPVNTKGHSCVSIVPCENQFFIISDEVYVERKRVANLLFEYRYNSNTVIELNATEEYVDTIEWNFDKTKSKGDYINSPDLMDIVFVDRGTIWNLSTDGGLVSSLIEIGVSPDRRPVVTYHSPPPISGETDVYMSKVSKNVLEKLRPVSLMRFWDMPLKEMIKTAKPYK